MNKTRESGIELLRIVAACMVVLNHIFGFATMNQNLVMGGGNMLLINILCDMSVSAVNIFIIITGYFLSKNNVRVIGKPLYLILMMVFFSVSMYIMKVLLTGYDNVKFSWNLIFPTSYFVTLYTVLYIVSPYINKLLDSLNRRSLTNLIILLVCVFSVYPTIIDVLEEVLNYRLPALSPISAYGSQWGYNIVNFILLYCIGAYINRIEDTRLNIKWYLITFIISVAVIFVWHTILENYPGYNSSAHNYHNPFVILSAVALFGVFKNIHFKSRIVNFAAKSAFAVYLFHSMVLSYIYLDFHIGLPMYYFVVYLFVAIVLLYFLSTMGRLVFDTITSPLFKRVNSIEIPFCNIPRDE